MAIFSFRAETRYDANAFFTSSVPELTISPTKVIPVGLAIDVKVEFESNGTLEQLREILRKIIDGHVMLETLREVPLDKNSLERDRTIE